MSFRKKTEMFIICRTVARPKLKSIIFVAIFNLALVIPVAYFNMNILLNTLCIISIIFTLIALVAFICNKNFIFSSFRNVSFVLSIYLALLGYVSILESYIAILYSDIVFCSIMLWCISVGVIFWQTMKKIRSGFYLRKRKQEDRIRYWMESIGAGAGAAIALVFKSHLLILAIIIIVLANLIIIMALKDATQDMIAHCYQKELDNQ